LKLPSKIYGRYGYFETQSMFLERYLCLLGPYALKFMKKYLQTGDIFVGAIHSLSVLHFGILRMHIALGGQFIAFRYIGLSR
jgi:hypothetical protein